MAALGAADGLPSGAAKTVRGLDAISSRLLFLSRIRDAMPTSAESLGTYATALSGGRSILFRAFGFYFGWFFSPASWDFGGAAAR